MAVFHHRFQNIEESKMLYMKALTSSREALGTKDPFMATIAFDLANLLITQNEQDRALFFMEKAMKIRKKCLGKNDPKTLETMKGLARILALQNKPAESKKLLDEVKKYQIAADK
jgi:hypothetical protein